MLVCVRIHLAKARVESLLMLSQCQQLIKSTRLRTVLLQGSCLHQAVASDVRTVCLPASAQGSAWQRDDLTLRIQGEASAPEGWAGVQTL